MHFTDQNLVVELIWVSGPALSKCLHEPCSCLGSGRQNSDIFWRKRTHSRYSVEWCFTVGLMLYPREPLGFWEKFCQNSFDWGIPKFLLIQASPSFLMHKGDRRLCIASQTSEEDSGYAWAGCELRMCSLCLSGAPQNIAKGRERERRRRDKQTEQAQGWQMSPW